MTESALRLSTALLVAVTLSGCSANWQPINVSRPRQINERTVLEFHAKNELVRLHGVRFERDSVSGIPWLDHLSCDTCRVHYALAAISGPRTGNPGAAAWGVVIPIAAIIGGSAILAAIICGGGACGG